MSRAAQLRDRLGRFSSAAGGITPAGVGEPKVVQALQDMYADRRGVQQYTRGRSAFPALSGKVRSTEDAKKHAITLIRSGVGRSGIQNEANGYRKAARRLLTMSRTAHPKNVAVYRRTARITLQIARVFAAAARVSPDE